MRRRFEKLLLKWAHSSIVFLSLFVAGRVGAQEVLTTGVVRDAETQTPLVGVIVSSSRSDGVIENYVVSASDGAFSLVLSEETNAMTFSLLGYEKVVLSAPFPSPLQIRMKVSQERIASAVVTSHSVEERGDTISYNAASIRGRDDRHLGDLLKRLPGIEVARSGAIIYNGRQINRLYIEGRDILRGDFNMATTNLDAKAIKSIDIYRGHQPLKVLRGIIESDEAALNITLDDYVKGAWTGSLEMGGGYSWEPAGAWAANLLGLFIGRKDASINKVNTNSIGALPMFGAYRPNVYRPGEELVNRYRLLDFFSLTTDEAPLENVHSSLNNSFNAQTVDHHAFSEDISAGVSVKYSRDLLSSVNTSRQQYMLQDGLPGPLFADITQKLVGATYVSAVADIVSNKTRHYLKDVLYVDLQSREASSNISLPEALDQKTYDKNLNVDNIFDATLRAFSRSAIRIQSYSQFSHKQSALSVLPGDLTQDVNSDVFYTTLQLSGITQSFRGWKFMLSPSLVFLWRKQAFNLVGLPSSISLGRAQRDLNFWLLRPILELEVSRRINQWRIGFNLLGEYRQLSARTDKEWRRAMTLATGSAFVKYARGRVELDLSYDYQLQTADDQTFVDALVLCSYNTVWSGRQELTQVPVQQARFSFGYREPLTGIYVRLTSLAMLGASNPKSRQLHEHFVVQQESDQLVRMRSLENSLSLSRGLPAIRGKIDAGIRYDMFESEIWQNETPVNYKSSTLRGSLSMKANPWRWVGLEYSGGYAQTVYLTDGSEEPVRHEIKQDLSLSVMPGSSWEFRCSAEHLLNIVSSAQGIFLLDADVSCKLNSRLRLYLSCINLMNEREYVRTVVSPLLVSSVAWKIRPRTLLLGAEWKF